MHPFSSACNQFPTNPVSAFTLLSPDQHQTPPSHHKSSHGLSHWGYSFRILHGIAGSTTMGYPSHGRSFPLLPQSKYFNWTFTLLLFPSCSSSLSFSSLVQPKSCPTMLNPHRIVGNNYNQWVIIIMIWGSLASNLSLTNSNLTLTLTWVDSKMLHGILSHFMILLLIPLLQTKTNYISGTKQSESCYNTAA